MSYRHGISRHIALPQELWDLTFKCLRDVAAPSLLQCALVSRSWCSATRRHTFGHIEIVVQRATSFVKLLGSPLRTIGRHIQKVTLVHSAGCGVRYMYMSLQSLQKLLAQLPGLRVLHCRGVFLKCTGLTNDPHTPSKLDELVLHNVTFTPFSITSTPREAPFAQFLSLFSEVHSIVYNGVGAGLEYDTRTSLPTTWQQVHVHELCFGASTHISGDTHIGQPIPGQVWLDKLSVHDCHATVTKHLVESFGKNTLCIELKQVAHEDFEPLNFLSHFHHKSLIFRMVLHTLMHRNETNTEKLRTIADTLSTLPRKHLTGFHIEMNLCTWTISPSHAIPSESLKRFDDIVAQRRDVADVSLTIDLRHLHAGYRDYYASLRRPGAVALPLTAEYVRTHLPHLAARGALQFTQSEGYIAR